MMPISISLSRVAKRGDPSKLYDVIIVGSGPAGLTAAIYALRSGLSTLLVTGLEWGGQLMTTTKVDNYPGFPEGIDGPELMKCMREQAIRFGVEIVEADADDIILSEYPYRVKVGSIYYTGKTIILATGARYRELGLESEKRLLGRGVSYCAVCDGFFFKNKVVAVIGGGDTALTDAIYLSSICKEVLIIHRRGEFRANKILVNKIKEYPNIKVVMNSIVLDILGDNKVEAIKVKNLDTGSENIIKVDGVFIAIGHVPNTDLVKDKLEIDERGYIKTYDFVKTSIPGVYVAGDVMDPKYQQAITAAAFGAMAALEAKEFIDKESKPIS